MSLHQDKTERGEQWHRPWPEPRGENPEARRWMHYANGLERRLQDQHTRAVALTAALENLLQRWHQRGNIMVRWFARKEAYRVLGEHATPAKDDAP